MIPEAVAAFAVKLGAAFLGAALALIFQPPRTIMGGLQRLAVSVPCGIVFHPQLSDWLKWPRNWDNDFAAIVLGATLSWWCFGAAIRVLGLWRPKQ